MYFIKTDALNEEAAHLLWDIADYYKGGPKGKLIKKDLIYIKKWTDIFYD